MWIPFLDAQGTFMWDARGIDGFLKVGEVLKLVAKPPLK
jgi:hypothetical protein